MTLKLEIMLLIGKQLNEMLGENYTGQTVLVKFSGEIIRIFQNEVDALKWAENIKTKDFFVHRIKSE